jgi:hypothetical protein
MKTALVTALLTAAVCFAVTATTGFASQDTASRHLPAVKIGDDLTIPSLDLYCAVYRTDPDHLEVGPILYCNRNSADSQHANSRGFGASRFHIFVSTANGNANGYTVTRSP